MQRNNLKEKYKKEAVPKMMEKFGLKNPMAVLRIEKVVINCGFGRQVAEKTKDEQKKFLDFVLGDISLICGQKAISTRAKKSISAFKLREGTEIGAVCTLRGRKMYDFLERLIYITLPRTRDFKGIDPKSIDGQGNLSLGIKEHITFPEILPEKARNIFGLEITVVSNAKSKEKGLEFFKLMGFPIK